MGKQSMSVDEPVSVLSHLINGGCRQVAASAHNVIEAL
jgi:hypothetical protein